MTSKEILTAVLIFLFTITALIGVGLDNLIYSVEQTKQTQTLLEKIEGHMKRMADAEERE